MRHFRLVSSLLVLLAAAMPAFSQNPSAEDEFMRAAEESRTVLRAERKLLLGRSLELTAEEGAAFWPIYDQYASELRAAGDLRQKLTLDYAKNYRSMTDETATQLLADAQKYEQKVLDIRKNYAKKMRKALPPIKLARFFQVEFRLDTINDLMLATQIPIIQ
jgi:hypothetical protein